MWRFYCLLCAILAPILYATEVNPSPISSSSSDVIRQGDRFDILGGEQSGSNLFHTFEQFGLDSGQIANFLSAPSINNILGRVVGGDPSLINGLIQVTGSNANLYLMNPAGIVFGANASLNVPGDFFATTATGIGFGDGVFSVVGANDYTSLTGTPLTFEFDVINPAPIINAGNLNVGTGQDLGLVAGSVANVGTLSAPRGNITVAAIPGTNRVKIAQAGMILTLEPTVPTSEDGTPLPFSILDLPALLTAGENIIPEERLAAIQNNFPQDPATAWITGEITARNEVGNGGEIAILGDRITLFDAKIDVSGHSGGGNTWIGGDYQGTGDLPRATDTYINEGSTILADAIARGNAGNVIVWADKLTEFSGRISALGVDEDGFVEVSGKETLLFQGRIDAGRVLLDPRDIVIGSISPADFALVTGDTYDAPQQRFPFSLNFIAGELVLYADRNIVATEPLNLTNPDSVTFIADFDGDGGGGFYALNDILTSGDITIAAGEEIQVTNLTSEGNITLTTTHGGINFSNLNTEGGAIALTSQNDIVGNNILSEGGAIALDSQNGSISMSKIDSSPPPQSYPRSDGGNISLISGGAIEVDGLIRADGAFLGKAGEIFLNANGDILLDGASSIGYEGNKIKVIGRGNFTSTSPFVTAGIVWGGNINLNIFGNVENTDFHLASGAVGLRGGWLEINAGGNLTIGNVTTDAGAGQPGLISLDAGGNIRTGFLSAQGVVSGGDVTIDSTNSIEIVGTINATGNVEIAASQELTILGVQTPSNSIVAGGTVGITTGTPLSIARAGESTIWGAIQAGSGTIADIDFADSTILNDFKYTRLTPTATASPSTPPPAPIAIATSATWQEAIALALDRPLTETQNDAGTLLKWGEYSLFIPSPNFTTTKPLSETPAIATEIEQITATPQFPPDRATRLDRQLTIDFNKYFKEQEIPQNPVSTAIIRDNLETVEAETGTRFALLYIRPRDLEEPGKSVIDLALFRPHQDPKFISSPPIRRGEIQKLVKEYRQNFSALNDEWYSKSRELYALTIALVEPYLEDIGAIAFALDDGVRGLPVAALHDGENLLIEKYAVSVIPSFSLIDPKYKPIWNNRVLAAGVSNIPNWELPAVEEELGLIGEFFPSETLLNENFTLDNFRDRLSHHQIAHLATHADISNGVPRIQFSDRWVEAEEFRRLGFVRRALVVLSACETGRGFPELGISGTSLALGFNSAVGTLWRVSDRGTVRFMERFYRSLADPNTPTLAESIQQAQLEMLREEGFSHPYYWSGFTLVGTPW